MLPVLKFVLIKLTVVILVETKFPVVNLLEAITSLTNTLAADTFNVVKTLPQVKF